MSGLRGMSRQLKYVFLPDEVEVVRYSELVKWYEEAESGKALSRELGVSWSTLHRHLARAGADLRGGREGEPSQLARLEQRVEALMEENAILRRALDTQATTAERSHSDGVVVGGVEQQ